MVWPLNVFDWFGQQLQIRIMVIQPRSGIKLLVEPFQVGVYAE